jgi:hypothetical protein
MRILSSLITLFILSLMVLSILAQNGGNDEDPSLRLNVSGWICNLALVDEDSMPETTAEPEVTPEAEVTPEPIPDEDYALKITVGDDCDDVIARLRAASNGTLWLALSVPSEDAWQQFATLEDDDYPPRLDRRGRYIGCHHPEQGEQVCRVLWEHDETIYLVEIPIMVGGPYIAPVATLSPTSTPTQPPEAAPHDDPGQPPVDQPPDAPPPTSDNDVPTDPPPPPSNTPTSGPPPTATVPSSSHTPTPWQ